MMKMRVNGIVMAAAILLAIAAGAGPVGPEFLVNTYTSSDQSNPSAGMDSSGNFVIAWDSGGAQDGSSYGVYAQRYSFAGVPMGGEFVVNTTTAGQQINPSVAMAPSGDFVVAWISYEQDGSGAGVYAQLYDATGAVQGGEFLVNTYTDGDQGSPSAAMDSSNNFVIAWHSYDQDGGGKGVYAQRYNALGTPQGLEFRVNSTTANDQQLPSVAIDPSGNFVIAWQSLQDGSGTGIYTQLYDSAGVAQGSELQVNTYTIAEQRYPSAGMDSSGNFVIAWESDGQDSDAWGVYARRYSALGVPQGAEFLVNTRTPNSQFLPAVGIESSGDFVVTWSSYQNGSGTGVYAQRYDALGVSQGAEFRVNTYMTNDQRSPSICMNATGYFVVAWGSDGQDSDGYGVYAQRYDNDFDPPAVPVITSPNGGAGYETSDSSPVTISGTCALDTYSIKVNGSTSGVTYTPGETTWSYVTGVLVEGPNVFDVTATDAVYNTSAPATIIITLDTIPPAIVIGPPSQFSSSGEPVSYTVTYTDADAVTLADVDVTLNTTGSATGTVAVTGTGNVTRVVTISNITGVGTLGITLATGTANDLAGNYALTAGPSASFDVVLPVPVAWMPVSLALLAAGVCIAARRRRG